MERRGKSGHDAPRDQQDTIPVDSDVLGMLKSLSRIDDEVDSLLAVPIVENPEAAARVEQVSVAFDLTRPPAIALTDVRPPQVSIPFELSRETPIELSRQTPIELKPRAPSPDVAWASVPPAPRSRLMRWIVFVVLLAALAAELVVSGVGARVLKIIRHAI
jgi:hypothetical protein